MEGVVTRDDQTQAYRFPGSQQRAGALAAHVGALSRSRGDAACVYMAWGWVSPTKREERRPLVESDQRGSPVPSRPSLPPAKPRLTHVLAKGLCHGPVCVETRQWRLFKKRWPLPPRGHLPVSWRATVSTMELSSTFWDTPVHADQRRNDIKGPLGSRACC